MTPEEIINLTDEEAFELFSKSNFGTLLVPILGSVNESDLLIITMGAAEPDLKEVYVYLRSIQNYTLLGHIWCRRMDVDMFNRLSEQICPNANLTDEDVWIDSETVSEWVALQ